MIACVQLQNLRDDRYSTTSILLDASTVLYWTRITTVLPLL